MSCRAIREARIAAVTGKPQSQRDSDYQLMHRQRSAFVLGPSFDIRHSASVILRWLFWAGVSLGITALYLLCVWMAVIHR